MENEVVRIWNKKRADLTVGDTFVVQALGVAAIAAGTFVLAGASGAAINLYEKIRSRKNVVVEVVKTEEV